MQLRALDLFSGAGGAARGLQRAGFHVTGVDIRPQPRYAGDAFIQADALTFPLDGYDLIHASPPCQAYSPLRSLHPQNGYPDLIAATRERLSRSGAEWIIENVIGAPLRNPIRLCGAMFGLRVRRHRHFEASFPLLQPGHQCWGPSGLKRHNRPVQTLENSRFLTVVGHGYRVKDGAEAMGISWMTGAEL